MKINKVIVLWIILMSSTIISGQGYGKITGQIKDASTGEALPYANIIIEKTSLGTASDIEGNFTILRVPSGRYNIKANFVGYQQMLISGVEVLTDLTTDLEFELSPMSIEMEGEIVVSANAPMVRKDLTSTEARVTAEEIANLPVQDLNQVIDLQAGVNRDAGGGIHIRGGRSTEVLYMVNGISITDDFTRLQAVQLETGSIQELQIISGSFNAEYGNAMSGVINLVTKSGTNEFKSGLEILSGNYFTSNDDVFWSDNSFDPINNYDIQGFISGALIPDDLFYFASIRRFNNGGWIFGKDIYSPQGNLSGTDTTGSGEKVSLNGHERWSGQLSLEYRILKNLRVKTDLFANYDKQKYYNHIYRLNPNGYNPDERIGLTGVTKISHQISSSTFQDLTFAYRYNDYTSKLYDSPFDERYVHPDSANVSGFQFLRAGTDLNRFFRSTSSAVLKWELSSQLNKSNLIKVGIETQFDRLFYEDINLVPLENEFGQEVVPFVPSIRGVDVTSHDMFTRTPFKLSAFIQDKIELESLILNIGIRFDLFDPQGKIAVDEKDPNIYNPFRLTHIYKDLNLDGDIGLDEQIESNKYSLAEKEKFWWKETSLKTQISPRIGIAYPITDEGIIRFSFGIFQQIPEYSQLYLGDEIKLTSSQGIQGPFGNPDLKPQRTTIYEIGLQQKLSENFAMDVTGFYRDIRDWVSTGQPIQTVLAGNSYAIRINRDFANVRGITLALNKRFAENYAFTIDYTFQVAEGTNSTPEEEFFAQADGSEPTKVLTPLNWDQTHTVNATLFFAYEGWGASLISRFNTGQPYTPSQIAGAYSGRNIISGLTENSRNKPDVFNVDLELNRKLNLFGQELQFFVKVFNLLDAKNPTTVFGDTGLPDYTLQQDLAFGADDGWFVYPNFYSEPRKIFLGLNVSF
ncbi:MAG: TonB-dependent receptor [Melioribacteraceae bacterium]|nr:TonB-dependent receptor [Melioribacteraceae bacterium]MCF8263198.1 TonB-dependent receptor [Melioribacteraceae bacterium]MCF8431284.1 TonB-dependent receptor [Melioribacteraceae bacterium]